VRTIRVRNVSAPFNGSAAFADPMRVERPAASTIAGIIAAYANRLSLLHLS
jgi:hypothetical protein